MDLQEGYDTDDILSQALDIFEDADGENIFLTQSSFSTITESQCAAVQDAVDISDLLDEGQPYEICARRKETDQKPSLPPNQDQDRSSTRFKSVTSKTLAVKQRPHVPENTIRQTRWALNIFEKWREHVLQNGDSETEDLESLKPILQEHSLESMDNSMIDVVLSVFFLAIRKCDGTEYKSESIFNIACSMQRYLQEHGHDINLFNSPELKRLRTVIDNVMKDKCRDGTDLVTRKASIITESQENALWEKGILGTHDPLSLSRALFWTIGVNFGLRGGAEHRDLTFSNFEIKTDDHGLKFLNYQENVSKTFKGGLNQRGLQPHSGRAYENRENAMRCPVNIFEIYRSKLPEKLPLNAFYFKPVISTPLKANSPWFTRQILGHNKLKTVVKDIMAEGGYTGQYTNHSLRATTATRLFRANVSDQLIREQTGHRSDAVYGYKRTSDEQKVNVSSILQLKHHREPEPELSSKMQKLTETDSKFSFKDCTVTFNFQK